MVCSSFTESCCPDRRREYMVTWTGNPHDKSVSKKTSMTVCDPNTHTLYVWCQIFLCPYRVLYSVQWDSANKHRLQCWRNCVLSLCFLPSFSSCLWCCWWEELGSLVEHPVSWFWLSSLSPWWPRCPVCLLWALWQKQVQQKMRWSLAAVLQCTVWDQFVLLSGWGQFFFFPTFSGFLH